MKPNVFAQWREYARIKNERMTPRRKKFNVIGILLLVLWTLITVGAACVCMSLDFNEFWWLALLCFLATISGVVVFIGLKRKTDYYEAVDELERLSYLFKQVHLTGDEQLEVEGLEEDGVDFVLSKDGIRIKFREAGEQVFDDGMDDGKFYSWDDLDLFLAASNEFFRINLGLAILSKQPVRFVNGEDQTDEDDDIFFILPLCPNLALALHAFCWDKLSLDWLYVFYQPLDAFLQIMKNGRLQSFKDRESGEELTEELAEQLNEEKQSQDNDQE